MEEARAAQAVSSSQTEPRRREILQNGFSHPSRSTRSTRREPAPRLVPQRGQTVYQPPLILTILFTPFNLLYQLLSGTFRFLGTIIPLSRVFTNLGLIRPPQPRDIAGREPLNPRDTTIRFGREFEKRYGSHGLRFHQDGYAQTYDLAKKELKFLLVVLLSPENDDTEAFVRGSLLSDIVVNYINDPHNNIIIWAGTILDSEPYQLSNALDCTKFPFAALISHTPQDSSTSMSIIARISGLTSPTTFVARLRAASSQQAPALEQVRLTRQEQQASRNLLSEQNSAYERSLAQDRERARRKREAEAAKVQAEQVEKAALEAEDRKQRNLAQWRSWRAQAISAEPAAASKDVSRVSIRLPSGERVIRKFNANAPMEELYAFVECYDVLQVGDSTASVSKPEGYEHEFGFRLVSPMPRMVYDIDSTKTIGESIGRSGTLIVETTEGDNEEA